MTALTAPAPRVLVEGRDPVAAAALARLLREEGLEVDVCRGPGRLPEAGCPVLTEGSCALAERCDVVVFDLDLDDPTELEMLEVSRLRYPELPVVLEAPVSVARRHRAALAGCHVIPPISPEHLLGVVLDAVRTRRRPVTTA